MIDYDVLIVGAGLSGISAAYRLQAEHPNLKFAVLEAREAVGGTWDLFRYPGVRSDSDMYTFGFPFEPWSGSETVADGETIRAYVQETVAKHGLDKHILYGHRLREADWDSDDKVWRVSIKSDKARRWNCRFLWLCTGYYKYEHGYQPELPGIENFRGEIVHPQHWPENFNYDRDVVVLGSGATAVTLVPELARLGSRVTILQRSPSYVSEVPRIDPWVGRLLSLLPRKWAMALLRWKGILYQGFVFRLARRFPKLMKKLLRKPLVEKLGEDFVDRHFTPRYNPWEQRLCADADGEFLNSLQDGRVKIVTDEIEQCKESGFLLKSGQELSADVLVSATGLIIELFGGTTLSCDGRPLQSAEHLIYKGCMLSDTPNLFLSLGYTNMSWTLKCDLIARYVCRLLTFMDENDFTKCNPRRGDVTEMKLIDFSSGYFQRAAHLLPKQGNEGPWKLHQSYVRDLMQTDYAPLDDNTMMFE